MEATAERVLCKLGEGLLNSDWGAIFTYLQVSLEDFNLSDVEVDRLFKKLHPKLIKSLYPGEYQEARRLCKFYASKYNAVCARLYDEIDIPMTVMTYAYRDEAKEKNLCQKTKKKQTSLRPCLAESVDLCNKVV